MEPGYSKGNYEAMKKKTIIFGIICLISLILTIIFGAIQNPICILFLVITVISGIIYTRNLKGAERIKNIYCTCGYKYNYLEDVKITFKKDSQETKTNNDGALIRDTSTFVKFDCTCPKCNVSKQFAYTFPTKSEQLHPLSGVALHTTDFNLEDQIKKYFE